VISSGSGKIEIGVIGQIDDCILVSSRKVVDSQRLALEQRCGLPAPRDYAVVLLPHQRWSSLAPVSEAAHENTKAFHDKCENG
jgi:hypothetical protein